MKLKFFVTLKRENNVFKNGNENYTLSISDWSLSMLKTGSSQKEPIKVLTKCCDGMTGCRLDKASWACSLPFKPKKSFIHTF